MGKDRWLLDLVDSQVTQTFCTEGFEHDILSINLIWELSTTDVLYKVFMRNGYWSLFFHAAQEEIYGICDHRWNNWSKTENSQIFNHKDKKLEICKRAG